VTDRTKTSTDGIQTAFRSQAAICRHSGSPMYARLLELCARDIGCQGPVLEAIASWRGDPARGALPLRLMAAVHALVLTGVAKELQPFFPSVGGKPLHPELDEAFLEIVGVHRPFIRNFLELNPQTNECRRSVALLGGFLVLAEESKLPVRLLELGSSAGLNLLWDRFRYEMGPYRWGDSGAQILIRTRWEGLPPPLAARVEVRARTGCDLRPLSVSDEAQCRLLESWVWADQTERLDQLRRAISLCRLHPPEVEPGSAAPWLRRQLQDRRPGEVTVVFHSVVWPYLSEAEQSEVAGLLEGEGRRRERYNPLCWLRLEDAAARELGLELKVWPGGEDRLLARSHPHAEWVQWNGGGPRA